MVSRSRGGRRWGREKRSWLAWGLTKAGDVALLATIIADRRWARVTSGKGMFSSRFGRGVLFEDFVTHELLGISMGREFHALLEDPPIFIVG